MLDSGSDKDSNNNMNKEYEVSDHPEAIDDDFF